MVYIYIYIGIDTAAEVADLVARAFAQNQQSSPFTFPNTFNQPLSQQQSENWNSDNNRADQPDLFPSASSSPSFAQPVNGPGIIGNLLRVIGLDGGKIGALAVNGIIFIAQMVRNGVEKITIHLKQSIWDWQSIIHYLVQRVHDDENNSICAGVIVPNVVSITARRSRL